MYDLVIIGGGPAGLTAGIYAQRAGLNTILLEKALVGGQIAEAPNIENYPGFKSISGMELIKKFEEQATQIGLEIKTNEVKSLKKIDKTIIIQTGNEVIETKSVIVATGAHPRRIGVKGEEQFVGRGISYCATCDGPLFKDKTVAIVGGGDRAVKESLFLSKIVKKMYFIHRRDALRAEKINQERLFKLENIDFVWDSIVTEINGEAMLKLVKTTNVKTEKVREIEVDGLFVFVGIIPNTSFIDVEKDKGGFIVTNRDLSTSVEGVFAAGDCISKPLRQVANAVGEGATVAYNVEHYLEQNF